MSVFTASSRTIPGGKVGERVEEGNVSVEDGGARMIEVNIL